MLLNEKKINTQFKEADIIEDIDPASFITSERIDLIPKILYLQNIGNSFFEDLYIKSLQALNGLKEDDGLEKSSALEFLNSFNKTHKSIQIEGFNKKISLIPISKNGDILLDGAHRISSCYVLNKKVSIVKVEQESTIYNYNYFASKGFNSVLGDFVLQKYIDISQKFVFSGILWGKTKGKLSEVKKIIRKYDGINICVKEILLTEKGKRNLIINCYKGEKWLGNIQNNYIGAEKKVNMCFGTKDTKIRVLFFEFNKEISSDTLIKLKDEIRDIFKIGKNSIHITDNKKETTELANIFLNQNSIHFLNNMEYKNYKSFNNLLENFINTIEGNSDNYCITGSGVLSLYGIRKGNDLDFISNDTLNKEENHNIYIPKFLGKGIEEVIYNPKNYFLLPNGIKALSIQNIKEFKNNRNEGKDQMDVQLINNTLSGNKTIIGCMRTYYLKGKRILIFGTLNILISVGIKIIPKIFLPFFKKIYYRIIG